MPLIVDQACLLQPAQPFDVDIVPVNASDPKHQALQPKIAQYLLDTKSAQFPGFTNRFEDHIRPALLDAREIVRDVMRALDLIGSSPDNVWPKLRDVFQAVLGATWINDYPKVYGEFAILSYRISKADRFRYGPRSQGHSQ
jgi:hypothetical protein